MGNGGEPRTWPSNPDLPQIMAAALFGITTLVGPNPDPDKPDMAGAFTTSDDGETLVASIELPSGTMIEMKLRRVDEEGS